MLFGVRLVRVHSNRLNSKCVIEDLGPLVLQVFLPYRSVLSELIINPQELG